MTDKDKKDLKIIGSCLLLAGCLFVVNLRVPPSLAWGIPYIFVVLGPLWSSRPIYVYYMAVLCTVLIGAEHFVHLSKATLFHPREILSTIHINHLLEVFVLWVSAFLGHAYKSGKTALEDLHAELKIRVREGTAERGETNKALLEKIKQQKITEDFLRKSEERFAHLLNAAGMVSWEGELKTKRFTYVGENAKLLLGYDISDWYREGFWDEHIIPADREYAVGLVQRLSETLDYFEVEYRMMNRAGNLVWIQDLVSVVKREGLPESLRGFMVNISERKQAEEVVRKSEARLRGVLEAAPDGMLMVRNDGRIAMANKQIENMLGYPSEEMVGNTLSQMIPARYRKDHLARIQSFFEAPAVRPMGKGMELRALHRDGREIPVEIGLSPLSTEEGVFTVAGIRDVSWRKEAEEALRENAQRLRLITENIKEILWIGSPDWREIVYVSPAYEAIWGRTTASLYRDGRSWMDGIHPEDRERVEKAVQKQVDGDFSEPFFPDFRVIGPGGKFRWIAARAYPVFDEEGKVFRITGVAEEITAEVESRRRFEKEHAETVRLKTLLEAVMQNMTTGLLVTDASGFILMLNRVGGEILGVPLDQVEGMNLEEVSPGLKVFHDDPANREAREVLFQRGDGRRIPIGYSSSPMNQEGGIEGGAITVFKDLTEQHEIEKKIREKEKLATIGEVAAGIAHEVKNPLFAISSGIQLLQHTLKVKREGLRTFDIIFQETMRVDRLIRQLLNYSGKRRLQLTAIALPDLIKEVLSLNCGLIEEKKLRVKQRFSPKLPAVMADRDLMIQVLINLIQNAIDVSPEGERLEVACRPGRKEGSIRVEISDNGEGVPFDIRDKIFDPFYSTKKGNTGMGLAISKRIILDHGGEIWIEDETPPGASFRFEIPLKPGGRED